MKTRSHHLASTLAALALSAGVAQASPAAGSPAPAFALHAINTDVAMDVAGSSVVGLDEFVGVQPSMPARAVLLAFVSSAAPDAAAELQALARLQKKMGGDLRILAIWADRDLGEIIRLAKDRTLPYPVLRDRFRIVSERYGVGRSGIEFVLIDAEGAVAASWTGSLAQGEDRIASLVQR